MKQQNQKIALLLLGMIFATTAKIEYQREKAAQDLQGILVDAVKAKIVPAHSAWALNKMQIWLKAPAGQEAVNDAPAIPVPANQEQGRETPPKQELTSEYFVAECYVVADFVATFESIMFNDVFRENLTRIVAEELAERFFTGIGLLVGYEVLPANQEAGAPTNCAYLFFCLAKGASKATKVKKRLQQSCPAFDSLSNALRKLIGKKKATIIPLPVLYLTNVKLGANPNVDTKSQDKAENNSQYFLSGSSSVAT